MALAATPIVALSSTFKIDVQGRRKARINDLIRNVFFLFFWVFVPYSPINFQEGIYLQAFPEGS